MTRADIEFFYRPSEPVEPNKVLGALGTNANLKGEYFDKSFLTEEDRKVIAIEWDKLVAEKGSKVFSTPGALATLYDTQNGHFTFRATEFKTYAAVSRTHAERPLSDLVYDNMRVAAVGCALLLADGTVYVHRRPKDATHVAGVLDSSFAGLAFTAHPEEGVIGNYPAESGWANIKWLDSLHKKLEREMGMKPEDLTSLRVTGVHSSGAPDFSGMIDFIATTDLKKEDIEARVNKEAHPERFYVKREDLQKFILKSYGGLVESESGYKKIFTTNMVGDGCATLLGVLTDKESFDTITKLQVIGGKSIRAGKLIERKGSDFVGRSYLPGLV